MERDYEYLIERLKQTVESGLKIEAQIPMNFGHSHDTLKVKTDQGSFVLKYLREWRHGAVLENTVAAHRLAKQAGVPIPDIVAYDASGEECGTPYIIMSYLDGEDYVRAGEKLTKQQHEQFFYDLGRNLALLHRIKGEAFSNDLMYSDRFTTWFDFLTHRLDKELLHMEKSGLFDQQEIKQVETAYRVRIQSLPLTISPTFVHRDVHPSNLLVNKQNFAALIDYEVAWYSDALWEFNKLELLYFNEHPELREFLYEGYRQHGEWPADAEKRLNLYHAFENMWAFRSYLLDSDIETAIQYKNRIIQWVTT